MAFLPAGLARADDSLPRIVQVSAGQHLAPVGSGIYHKLGFSVYRATLWAPDGAWNAQKPYALKLHYMRSVSKDDIVGVLIDDMQEQGVADDAKLAQWKTRLNQLITDVKDGDELVALYMPNKKSPLYLNGKQIARTTDPIPSQAFFNIWLGDKADEDLKNKLLGHS